MEIGLTLVFIGGLVFSAHLFESLFNKHKIPDVLFLLIIGMFLGPITGVAKSIHFGAIGPVFGTITLVIILFKGGMELNFGCLRKSLNRSIKLAVITILVTLVCIANAAWWLTDLSLLESYILGAILCATSSAVVIPLVRYLKMSDETSAIVVIESALSDVICIVLALALFEAYRYGEFRPGFMIGHMTASFVLASVIGFSGALLWSLLLKKTRMMRNSIFTTPAFVLIIFGITEFLGWSGVMSALVFGITISNIGLFSSPVSKFFSYEPVMLNETERSFFSEVEFLLRTFFFVYIGISVQLNNISWVFTGLVITFIIFAIRIPVVRFALPKTVSTTDASMIAILVPKGLASAVVASVLADQGLPGGELIQNVTYAVVLFSIVSSSFLIFLVGRTKVSEFYEIFMDGFARNHSETSGKDTSAGQ